MKTGIIKWPRFVSTFFLLFGALEFLFCIRGFLPLHNLGGITLSENLLCMAAALILTVSHAVISSEKLDAYISVRARLIICGIPCFGLLCVLTHGYGIPSVITHLLGINQVIGASIAWILSFAFCVAISALILWRVERRFHTLEKQYDTALAEYKAKAKD